MRPERLQTGQACERMAHASDEYLRWAEGMGRFWCPQTQETYSGHASEETAQAQRLITPSDKGHHEQVLWSGDTNRCGPERKPGESPALAKTPKLCKELKRWAARSVQGAGVGLFKRGLKSNDWLTNPSLKGFTARNFMSALKRRANMVPAKEALAGDAVDIRKRCTI